MHFSRLIVSIAIVLAAPSTGHAQCSFDAPAKAKGLKTSLIRAYNPCPSPTLAAPNTVASSGVPGCVNFSGAPVARSAFTFDDKKGRCSLKTSAKLESPCSTGTGIDCSNWTVTAKCSGILGLDGATPISGGAWFLNMVIRMTMNDPDGGDMTVYEFPVYDFPIKLPFDEPRRGSMKLRADTTPLLNFWFGPNFALPGCTAIELLSVAIADPGGDIFAVMGSSTR